MCQRQAEEVSRNVKVKACQHEHDKWNNESVKTISQLTAKVGRFSTFVLGLITPTMSVECQVSLERGIE